MARALSRMKSGTKTSRDVKRDRISDWKAPANHLNTKPRHYPARNTPNPQTIVVTLDTSKATTNHALLAVKSRRIGRVATATTYWTCAKPLRGPLRLDAQSGTAVGINSQIAPAPRDNGAHTGELVESRRTTECRREEQTRTVREEFGKSAATE